MLFQKQAADFMIDELLLTEVYLQKGRKGKAQRETIEDRMPGS
ncbi:MAG: hypothetical protein Q8881_02080 [Sweet potato little leaf phytoplasma]|nr:hypothetical protein [Sweet potato little leaf phytoplasma]